MRVSILPIRGFIGTCLRSVEPCYATVILMALSQASVFPVLHPFILRGMRSNCEFYTSHATVRKNKLKMSWQAVIILTRDIYDGLIYEGFYRYEKLPWNFISVICNG